MHAQGPDVFPIPGTKRLKYLEENAAAYFVELTAEDKRYLEETFHEDKVNIAQRIWAFAVESYSQDAIVYHHCLAGGTVVAVKAHQLQTQAVNM